MVLKITSNIWSDHFALYDLFAYNLWAPAVIPKALLWEKYGCNVGKDMAVKQKQTVKKIPNLCLCNFRQITPTTISEFLIR